MTLEQIFNEVDRLNAQEFMRLLEHVEERRKRDWARDFDEAVEALREGLSEDEINEMVQAMNGEYVKPSDDTQWQD